MHTQAGPGELPWSRPLRASCLRFGMAVGEGHCVSILGEVCFQVRGRTYESATDASPLSYARVLSCVHAFVEVRHRGADPE